MKRRTSASITVFAALSFMLISQLLFALLASARNMEFYKILQINSDAILESLFADYVSPLWEEYHILGAAAKNSAGEYGLTGRESMQRELSKDNLEEGSHLFHASVADLEFTRTLLMTDYGGKVFCQAVSSYMKNNIAYETAQSVYNRFEAVKDVKDNYGDGDFSIGNALDTLKNLEESQAEGQEDGGNTMPELTMKKAAMPSQKAAMPPERAACQEETPDSRSESDNLLTTVMEIKKKGILTLVLPKNAKVSEKEVSLEEMVSHRKLAQGNTNHPPESDWYDQVLLHQYLMHYLHSYTDQGQRSGLSYELEYLIGGKAGDRDNLKRVIHEIIAIREALNLASLVASPSKQAQALTLATLLAGVTVNPIIIEAVKYGILAAWAYAESILDLRALLQGERIAVIKSEVDWTSDLDAIPSLLSGWVRAKSSPVGLTYKDYLGILLFFHSSAALGMRTMDVQEVCVRKAEGYENFHMDSLLCEAEISVIYEYRPVFASMVWLGGKRPDKVRVIRSSAYSYFHERQV